MLQTYIISTTSTFTCLLLGFLCVSMIKGDAAASEECFPEAAQISGLLSTSLRGQISAAGGDPEPILRGNTLISPTSILLALLMAYPAARGNTKLELNRLLFSANQTQAKRLPHCTGGLRPFDLADGDDSNTTVSLYYQALFSDRFHVKPSYAEKLQTLFNLPLRHQNLVGAEPKLNAEILAATNDRIQDLIAPGTFDDNTAFVLVNALYFKAAWKTKFNVADTSDGDFFDRRRQNPKPVKFMRRKLKAVYVPLRSISGGNFLELPYANENFSMVIFTGIDEALLNGTADLRGLILETIGAAGAAEEGKRARDVHVTMPKFKLTMPTVELRPILKSMGVVDLFDQAKADLSGLSDSPTAVDRVLHKVFVKVDEQGSEAAAATALVGVFRSAVFESPTPQVVIDQPFTFVILYRPTRRVLFEGYVGDPQYS